MGVAPEVQERIFEPFFTTKPRGQGTGLGLPVIHGVVQDHGGRIEVQSKLGRGTTFTVVLPELEESAVADTAASSAVAPEGCGELILLAEDNRHVRSIMSTSLESFGYEVLEAGNGASLMECFERHGARIRLLVIDVDLPQGGGFDCLREIRAGGVRTPAIVISGEVDADFEDELDADTLLLSKPFQVSELGALVGNVLKAQPGKEDQT
jgi:CheY-like chemotaxis protein